jgi:hypothetical protein
MGEVDRHEKSADNFKARSHITVADIRQIIFAKRSVFLYKFF